MSRPPSADTLIEYPELEPLSARPWGGLRRACKCVEATWLGFAAPPLADRAASAGWRPDPPGTYCTRCGLTVGPGEGTAGDCSGCRERKLPWERLVRLGEHAGLLRELVHDIKFTAWRQLGTEVGRILGRSLEASMAESGVDPSRTVLVAMPTTYARRMGRGIDHARVIARGVRDVTGLPIVAALERSHRKSQVSVPASRRGPNVAGSFHTIPGVRLTGLTVVVIDDVLTTGATMGAACRTLAKGVLGRGQEKYSASDRALLPLKLWAVVVGVAVRPGFPARSSVTAGRGVEEFVEEEVETA